MTAAIVSALALGLGAGGFDLAGNFDVSFALLGAGLFAFGFNLARVLS